MKKLMMLCCMGLMFTVSSAVLAGTQQERMSFCSKDAKGKGLKGDERKAFMSNCLRKKSGPVDPAAEQALREKKASCSQGADGKELKGKERRKFMRKCMKS